MGDYWTNQDTRRRASQLADMMRVITREANELKQLMQTEREKAMNGDNETKRVFNANRPYWLRDHQELYERWWEYYRQYYALMPREYSYIQNPDGELQMGWRSSTAIGNTAPASLGSGMKKPRRGIFRKRRNK